MAKRIQGITVEIGGDTTKLQTALKEVDGNLKNTQSQLKDIEKLLKLDPGNIELLSQKQRLLADSITETESKLKTLNIAAEQANNSLANGDISQNQYDALRREIIETENKLKGLVTTANKTESELKNLDGNANLNGLQGEIKETEKDLEALSNAANKTEKDLSSMASKGIKGVVGAATGISAAMVGVAESTREYRTDIGKLNTAFKEAGYGADVASKAYQGIQSVLGESDTSVEAANHLAKLCDSEEELSNWTGNILPGVFATFGDSLPLEGLTEAANETAKTGSLTGSLADALNWAGINEDKFQESLDACSSEQERQKLITDTLSKTYGAASAEYLKINAAVVDANAANEKLTQSLAGVGEAAEPAITKVKEIGAELLEKLTPAIKLLCSNLPTVIALTATIATTLATLKITSFVKTLGGLPAILTTVTAAAKGLTVAMATNPAGLAVLAIGSLITVLVALWNKCEGFRNFWIGLWNSIKNTVTTIITGIKNGIVNGASGIVNALSSGLNAAKNFVVNLAKSAYSWGKDIVQGIANGITGSIKKLVGAVKNVANTIRSYLHFSVPDKGPLTDYESWMPDFIKGLAKGINGSKGKLEKAISGVAADLVLTPEIGKLDTSNLKASKAIAGTAATATISNQTVNLTQPIMLNGHTLVNVVSKIQWENGKVSARNLGRA